MDIDLKKQKITPLKVEEYKKILGGGERRSDRRTGNCRFSRKTGVTLDQCGSPTGCYPSC